MRTHCDTKRKGQNVASTLRKQFKGQIHHKSEQRRAFSRANQARRPSACSHSPIKASRGGRSHTSTRRAGRAHALLLPQTEQSSSAYGRMSLCTLSSHATRPSFPMTSASSLDTTVIDEGNVELCAPVTVDSELFRVLLQQLSEAHTQARKPCLAITDLDRALRVAWIP